VSTHPDFAALVDPLFACGVKRVGEICRGGYPEVIGIGDNTNNGGESRVMV